SHVKRAKVGKENTKEFNKKEHSVELRKTNNPISKKLLRLNKGIARYCIIFLPETNVEDMIHKSFAFNIPKNVQKLLETYNEVITRESTGFQISLTIGWFHDAIIIMRLLGIDFQIGYGEVVGNPCYHDDSKRDEDCEKVLKDKKRDVFIYSTHWVDGIYLVDQIDGFSIPGISNQIKQASSNIIESMLEIFFAKIPCDNEKIVRLHFHLINPIKFGETSSSIDIQFAKGISNVKNIKIDEVDDDEDEEVKRLYEELEEEVVEEEKQKGLINKWFRDFAKNISIRSGITIDTFRDIKFSRNPFKNQVLLQPTTNCLVHLINLSFLVITMADVEVVNLERIQYGLKNFDMVLIFKDYSHPLVHINTIPMSQLEGVKSWLDSIGIVYYEGTLNLNWTQIVRNINKDPAGFYTNGGLSFLDMDGKDDDDLEVSSDSASEFKLTESEEEDSEAKESVSASELEEESDESVLSQDELKERAPKVDKKIQDIKRKNSNDVHGSSSTNTNKKPSQS
ncbi:9775_t:CDS:10, partial [Entrophospora sp. SA101]